MWVRYKAARTTDAKLQNDDAKTMKPRGISAPCTCSPWIYALCEAIGEHGHVAESVRAVALQCDERPDSGLRGVPRLIRSVCPRTSHSGQATVGRRRSRGPASAYASRRGRGRRRRARLPA